jgi:hypothetical protein
VVTTLAPLTPLVDAAEATAVLTRTQLWVERAVIGLNLCPFAKAVHAKRQIRYSVTGATTGEELLAELAQELTLLDQADPESLSTTLLVHPAVMTDFLEYNAFLETADDAVQALGLEGVLQVASFHPQYQFADSGPDDIDNYSNRSPFPTLHLLREESIDRAVDAFPSAEAIFGANIRTLRQLGKSGWRALFEDPGDN